MINCKLFGHNFSWMKEGPSSIICTKCGVGQEQVQRFKQPKGKAQFLEPKSFEEKFREAKTIDELLD